MENYKRQIEIIAKNDEQQKVWGIFSLSKMNDRFVVDHHGDIIKPDVLQKAAHDFVLSSRMAGAMHKEMGVGRLIESFVFTKETTEMIETVLKGLGVEDVTIQPNAEFWVGAFKIDDEDVWKSIKKGEFKDFSIGGSAVRAESDKIPTVD